MALDPVYFSLQNALAQTWNDAGVLDERQKGLIRRCLLAERDSVIEGDLAAVVPTSEAELGTLQRVLAACDEIARVGRDAGNGWLTDDGLMFPVAIRSYIQATASYLHRNRYYLPDEFFDPLCKHVLDHRSHIATLNYDELLYRKFANSSAMKGYGCLIDGFIRGAFSDSNMSRFKPLSQSFYLHLHGSPMYISDAKGDVLKIGVGAVGEFAGSSSTHLVLTRFDYKTSVISSSEVLAAYWERLAEALSEVSKVTLCGYSGLDQHLNDVINLSDVSDVQVVEYGVGRSQAAQEASWKGLFPAKTVNVELLDNILDFSSW